jgi:hypothetical protein
MADKAYFIYCGTGCTCCNYQNHYCGPFSTLEIAEDYKRRFHEGKKLASQYAPNGQYCIEEETVDMTLPNGRVIINDRVFDWADDHGWEESFQEW